MTDIMRIEVPGDTLQPGDARFLETARWMAHEYAAGVAEMRAAVLGLKAAGERIMVAFSRAECERSGIYNRFDLDVSYHGATTRFTREGEDPLGGIERKFRQNAWAMLIDHLGIKTIMSVAKRAEFEKSLEGGDLPEVTEDAIIGTVKDLLGKMGEFATEAAKEVFEILRPHSGRYRTNSAFRVGRRVVLSYMVGPQYGRIDSGAFKVNYGREGQIIAIDSVFHLLDGKGPIKDRISPLAAAISKAPNGSGESDYFKFRAFKNGNLHLGFKRLDLVKELNFQGAGERVLGTDGDA